MDDSAYSDDDSAGESWIDWYCRLSGNEFLCEVDRTFIEDNFNLYGLREIFGTDYRRDLGIILDHPDAVFRMSMEMPVRNLYGMIHARFILTKRGQEKMLRKYKLGHFGVCTQLGCEKQHVLPVGLSDQLNDDSKGSDLTSSVMVYCPRCRGVYFPADRCTGRPTKTEMNGAYFGTTFPHLFMMQFSELWPKPPLQIPPYQPSVFGFKVRLPKQVLSTSEMETDSVVGENANHELQH